MSTDRACSFQVPLSPASPCRGSVGNGPTFTDEKGLSQEKAIQEAERAGDKSKPSNGCENKSVMENQVEELTRQPERYMRPLTYANRPLNAVGMNEWEEIEVIVDSGACETVMPRGMCSNIRIRPSAQSLAKVEYEVASGQTIPNLGERHCEVWAEGGMNSLLMHFQIADVHRPLLSLSKSADMGFRSYLDSDGGWLEDMQSG